VAYSLREVAVRVSGAAWPLLRQRFPRSAKTVHSVGFAGTSDSEDAVGREYGSHLSQ